MTALPPDPFAPPSEPLPPTPGPALPDPALPPVDPFAPSPATDPPAPPTDWDGTPRSDLPAQAIRRWKAAAAANGITPTGPQ